MRDEWTKKLSDGRIVTYTLEFEPGQSGVITAQVGEVTRTRAIRELMTREGVEASFTNL
jgi:hypothetical protein